MPSIVRELRPYFFETEADAREIRSVKKILFFHVISHERITQKILFCIFQSRIGRKIRTG